MTPISKPVLRITDAVRYSRGKHRRVIVSLHSTRIGFRLSRERKTYYLPIGDLYGYAVRAWAEAEKARKKAERKARKDGT